MAANSTAKEAQALLSKYTKLFHDKYNRTPKLNRYKEKWAMVDVIDSVGYERAQKLIEYYFSVTRPGHPLQWFFYNFDRLDEVLTAIEIDKENVAKLKAETKMRVEEWEQKAEH